MKKITKIFLLLFMIVSIVSCKEKYYENSFFSEEKLKNHLVSSLNKPEGETLYLQEYGFINDRVYVKSSTQTATEYFASVLSYLERNFENYVNYGRIVGIRDDNALVLGMPKSYYFSSTIAYSSFDPMRYYFESEHSFMFGYTTNEEFGINSSNEKYLKDSHLFTVCVLPGTYKNDNFTFEYDYYIEFLCDSQLYLERQVPEGKLKVTIIDDNDFLYDKKAEEESYYVPGTEVVLHACPIMDADIVLYIDDEQRIHYDYIIIDGNYIWEYRFIMPPKDIEIKVKVETVEYLSLKDILEGLDSFNQDNVIKVRKESGAVGVAPGRFTTIKYSENKEDISNVLTLSNSVAYFDSDASMNFPDGGGYVEYTFYTSTDSYKIKIINNYIIVNGMYYCYSGEYPSINNVSSEANSFITYINEYKAYNNENELLGTFNNLDEYEFVPAQNANFPDVMPNGYIETEFGVIYPLTHRAFYMIEDNEYVYYHIVGEKDFYDLVN